MIIFLHFLQDIIIKEAVNLSPIELESVLYKHPEVVKALVSLWLSYLLYTLK